jgi:hypothetical protein
MLGIEGLVRGTSFKPLESIVLTGAPQGTVSVRDGAGNEYVRRSARDPLRFKAAGALGNHIVILEDAEGRLEQTACFSVECTTEIRDARGAFKELLETLHWTMVG